MNTTAIAKKLEFNYEEYEFSHAKDNILVYTRQPEHFYDDWEEDGGILIVKYRNMENIHNVKDRYVVLHQLRVSVGSGRIEHVDISKENKIPTIID